MRWFFVIARGSTFAYKSRDVNPDEIARDLGVRYILTGSVRRVGDRIRVSAQLIDSNNRSNVWARTYDRAISDIFSVQDEITQTIVGGIVPELSRAERERARIKQRDSVDAWSIYQRGMLHLYRYTKDDLVEARKHFMEAIGVDPDLGPAHSAIAEAYYYEVVYGFTESPVTAVNRQSTQRRRQWPWIETMRGLIARWEEFAISVGNMLRQSQSLNLHWISIQAWRSRITGSARRSCSRETARSVPTFGIGHSA